MILISGVLWRCVVNITREGVYLSVAAVAAPLMAFVAELLIPGSTALFCNHAKVLVHYCDGLSFSGDRTDRSATSGLHYKGRRVLD